MINLINTDKKIEIIGVTHQFASLGIKIGLQPSFQQDAYFKQWEKC